MRVPTNMPPQRDWSDIASLQRELMETADGIAEMADEIAKAKQVREYDSERRRAALSCQVSKLLGDYSASAAEHMARASDAYHKAIGDLGTQLFIAEKSVAKYEGLKCRWESLRSVLSMAKHITNTI